MSMRICSVVLLAILDRPLDEGEDRECHAGSDE